jgi:hypothetical protein
MDKLKELSNQAGGAMSDEKFTEMLLPRLNHYDDNLKEHFMKIIGSQVSNL